VPITSPSWDDGSHDEGHEVRATVIGPVIGHVPCALDHQRRLQSARAERVARWAAARSAGRARRILEPPSPTDLRMSGEDVWKALRF
jgi:hypothetical protein